jgi:hypothetical protein
MAVDDSRGDVDEFAVVRPGTLVKHREGGLLTDRVALHQDPFGALNDSTAAKRAFGVREPPDDEPHDLDLEMRGAVEEDAHRGADAHSRGDADKPSSEQGREASKGEKPSANERQDHPCARHTLILHPPPPFRKCSAPLARKET